MDDEITIRVNGEAHRVPRGCVASAALARAGIAGTRRSVGGQPRSAFCGMGVCFECRITIDGEGLSRGCQRVCHDGMELRTDG
jgi:hypothetical protein